MKIKYNQNGQQRYPTNTIIYRRVAWVKDFTYTTLCIDLMLHQTHSSASPTFCPTSSKRSLNLTACLCLGRLCGLINIFPLLLLLDLLSMLFNQSAALSMGFHINVSPTVAVRCWSTLEIPVVQITEPFLQVFEMQHFCFVGLSDRIRQYAAKVTWLKLFA